MSDRPVNAQTEQVLQEQISSKDEFDIKSANLEKMVQLPTWREMLYDMVSENKLDAWNIDVAKVTNKYLEIGRASCRERV